MEAERASSRTLLSWGFADAPVALFKTTAEPTDGREFVKAGPNGKPLEKALAFGGKRYAPPEVEEPEEDDPFAASAAKQVREPDGESQPFVFGGAEPPERPAMATFEEGGAEPLDDDEVRKGLREGETFIDLTDQLAAIETDTKLEEMKVVGFIRREQVERYRIQGSYFLGLDSAGDEGPKAAKVLALLRHAILETQRVAVVKWTKRTRQSLGVIVPGPTASLVVLEMAWTANVLEPGPRSRDLDSVPMAAGERDAATGLAQAMFEGRDVLNEQEDDRVRMERELVEAALAGKVEAFAVPERPEIAESVDDLERLLELSVERV